MSSKKKIIMIADHALSTSGVGTQARFLMSGLIKTGKYTFRQLGAAIKHENYDIVKVSDDLLIKPIDGFGTQEMIRHILVTERPDALMLFTDPRFFNHIFAMHDEIHQVCPIIYNHLWDDSGQFPPTFNEVIYEICDLVNCINYPTYEFVKGLVPDKTNYIPHAVPDDMYFRLPDAQRAVWRERLVTKDRTNHFIVLFVGRNARRKRTSDILLSWRMFIDELKSKYGHENATLVMHTNPFDPEGPNLTYVIDLLKLHNNVIFSNNLIKFDEMNGVYNAVDYLINASLNEGFGLPVLEAKMSGTPCIATMTGGITRQIKDHETGFEYGIAMKPDLVTLVGNQTVPWIAEDFVSNENIAKALMSAFETSPTDKSRIGEACRRHCEKHYNLKSVISDWDESLSRLFDRWDTSSVKRWSATEL